MGDNSSRSAGPPVSASISRRTSHTRARIASTSWAESPQAQLSRKPNLEIRASLRRPLAIDQCRESAAGREEPLFLCPSRSTPLLRAFTLPDLYSAPDGNQDRAQGQRSASWGSSFDRVRAQCGANWGMGLWLGFGAKATVAHPFKDPTGCPQLVEGAAPVETWSPWGDDPTAPHDRLKILLGTWSGSGASRKQSWRRRGAMPAPGV